MLRRLLRWFIFLGVLGGIGYAIAVPGMQWYRKSSKVRFLFTTVNRGRVETAVNSTGTVKPVRTVTIGAVVSGPILKVHVDFNSVIKVGQLMAEIDPRLFVAAVKRDEASLRSAKADLDRVRALLQQAKNNEKRARELRKINRDYLSENELDQVRYARESQEAQEALARASIEQAEANLENSRANLGFTKITSPVNGIVIERKVDDGQSVASSFQTPEMFIVAPDLDKAIHVFASVDEADIGLISAARDRERKVTFTVDAYPQDVFEGKIFQVRKNSTTTQNVVTYPVVVEAKNTELKLMPGMTANLTFQIEAKENVLRVPSAALRYVPEPRYVHPDDRHYLKGVAAAAAPADPREGPVKQSAKEKAESARSRARGIVWVRNGELLRAVPVTLGLKDTQYAELISGDLKEGQQLVTGVAGPSTPPAAGVMEDDDL